MPLARDARLAVGLLRKALATRRARTDLRRALAQRGPLPQNRFRIAVYFADGPVNMYQMRQWYAPLRELAREWPVVVIARSIRGADALLRDDALPVAYAPTVRDVEQVLDEQDVRIVFYVNQNTRNFQMFRYGRRWHVFINHGESDKMYMTTNQFTAYDYAFVAGDAARARLSRTLWDYDLDRRTFAIGRPQADHYSGDLPYTPDGRRVVLYAPTWEGDRPAAHYGSILTHGEALVTALLATGRHRVIYRPHPRSGVVDAAYGAANDRIVAALGAANAADPTAQHVHDTGADLGWQLAAADLAVVDISAMVYDRLAAGRPLLVTRPVDPEALVDDTGYLSDAEWLDADSAADIVARADRVLDDPDAVARLDHWVRYYFGDTAPGASTERFHSAVRTLMERWESWNAGVPA
ncbi:CDP-glycerol glycerophosphotransferase family protein [Microbacterium sp. IEGM 1404]|uniref:CDP-glycerol glycerophosphotransferase family protein n=1 Tax=Microbacterium sp. IEGM 1404 TaxID=3047084 RepID=UPI0024B649B1|nr:CDP-glycerol glycerophosphotransferase family protein [Microbacterium sp. IEGM 1404]MDI9890088.1 CDP-glycerol glycerophosphotransferase family protein [Microbacterium sp. IEGM 1404]